MTQKISYQKIGVFFRTSSQNTTGYFDGNLVSYRIATKIQ